MTEFKLENVKHTVVGEIPETETPISISDVFEASRRIKGYASIFFGVR